MHFISSSMLLSVIAGLLLVFSVIAFLTSVRAIWNPHFRNKLLRDPLHLKQDSGVTLASAWLSAVCWVVLGAVLTLYLLHIESINLRDFLVPMAVFLVLAWLVLSYFEYRRRKRSARRTTTA